jgi:poly(A) polymerase
VTVLAPAWLKARALSRLFDALGAPAVDVRCVGGSVRDAVLGRDRATTEIDLGSPEPPKTVMARLRDAGIKCIPTGLAHGTVTAVVDGRGFEITSLRRDTACDGRHAAVEFTTDWREDARRRDFTMNAMSMDRDGALYDDHGGETDARAGRVRFVGDPGDRIQEDYLRILRLFRFAATHGRTPIDDATLAACTRHKDGLGRLSAERVQAEMSKLLAAADPAAALEQMDACGVLAVVLPHRLSVKGVRRMMAAEARAGIADHAWIRRLAALVPDDAVSAVALRLKLSRADAARLRAVVTDSIALNGPAVDVRRALFHDGGAIVADRLLRAWALWAGKNAPAQRAWEEAVAQAKAWTPHPLPVTGQDVLAFGIPPGPRVGGILAAMTEWWIDRGFKPTRAEALGELKRTCGE